jgi:hypothetical protein
MAASLWCSYHTNGAYTLAVSAPLATSSAQFTGTFRVFAAAAGTAEGARNSQ